MHFPCIVSAFLLAILYLPGESKSSLANEFNEQESKSKAKEIACRKNFKSAQYALKETSWGANLPVKFREKRLLADGNNNLFTIVSNDRQCQTNFVASLNKVYTRNDFDPQYTSVLHGSIETQYLIEGNQVVRYEKGAPSSLEHIQKMEKYLSLQPGLLVTKHMLYAIRGIQRVVVARLPNSEEKAVERFIDTVKKLNGTWQVGEHYRFNITNTQNSAKMINFDPFSCKMDGCLHLSHSKISMTKEGIPYIYYQMENPHSRAQFKCIFNFESLAKGLSTCDNTNKGGVKGEKIAAFKL